MQHEIYISSYQSDYGYKFSIIVDGLHVSDPETRRKFVIYILLDDFVSYIAERYDWNAGDVVKVVIFNNGGISINTVTVR